MYTYNILCTYCTSTVHIHIVLICCKTYMGNYRLNINSMGIWYIMWWIYIYNIYIYIIGRGVDIVCFSSLLGMMIPLAEYLTADWNNQQVRPLGNGHGWTWCVIPCPTRRKMTSVDASHGTFVIFCHFKICLILRALRGSRYSSWVYKPSPKSPFF